MRSERIKKDYIFYIRVHDNNNIKDITVEGKSNLESFLNIAGHYSYVIGMQDIITDVQKVGEGAFASVYEINTNY